MGDESLGAFGDLRGEELSRRFRFRTDDRRRAIFSREDFSAIAPADDAPRFLFRAIFCLADFMAALGIQNPTS
jgi:hypothetical protein